MNRLFANILSGDVSKTAQFYENLLGMTRNFESDWFVVLTHPDLGTHELGILRRNHEIIPEAYHTPQKSGMLTFVVDDVEAVYAAAQTKGVKIIEPPKDMFYGQRRLLVEDPDGTLVDISAPMPRA